MSTWIEKLAEDFSSEPKPGKEESTHLSIAIASSDVDTGKLYKLLSANGFPVVDISESKTEEKPPVPPAEGTMVTTTASVELGKGIMIKTPVTLYTVASAVLPAGYIGEVVKADKNAATVRFDANISVQAMDRSGYLDNVDYFVDTVEVPLNKLTVL